MRAERRQEWVRLVLALVAIEVLAAVCTPLVAYVLANHGRPVMGPGAFLLTAALTFFIALWPTMILHEAGHVIAVRWCGGRVDGLRLGAGPSRTWVRGDLTIVVGLIPFHGATLYRPNDIIGLRRNLAVVLGGVVGQLVIVAVAVALLFQPSREVALVASILILMQVVIILLNLVPLVVTVKGGLLRNDGMQAWRMVKRPG